MSIIKQIRSILEMEDKLKEALQDSINEIPVGDGLFLTYDFWVDKGRILLVKKIPERKKQEKAQ